MKKIDGVFSVDDLRDAIQDLYTGKSHKQYDCGYEAMKPYFKLIKPSFNLITGTPNSGKSSFVADVIMNNARDHSFKYLIFSPEHSLAVNVKRLCEKFIKKPFDIMFKNRINEKELSNSLDFISKHFYFIDHADDSPDIDWILSRCYESADYLDVDGIVVDPYNEINPTRNNLREDEHISLLISKIKKFNRETNTITFMVAHPNKQIRQADGRYVVTSAYDISGSSHWFNKSDTIMIVNRDVDKGLTDFRVCKVREMNVQGNLGEFNLIWDTSTRSFRDVDDIPLISAKSKKNPF
tara:strand:+ start:79 stop:963 length:885 start_codon:yes stop_codon:yes gene_type:complete